MKKSFIIFLGLLVAGCFFVVFFYAFEAFQKTNFEVKKIQASSITAIGNYYDDTIAPTVTFPSNPLFFDDNECVLICFAVTEISGVKYRTQFNMLLSLENRIWKANIIKVKRQRYLPPESKKAPWEWIWDRKPQ
jgi:hypothetical protein